MCEQVRQGMKLWDDGFALDHLLDAAAVQSSPANRKPVLWTLALKDKEIKDNEEAQE